MGRWFYSVYWRAFPPPATSLFPLPLPLLLSVLETKIWLCCPDWPWSHNAPASNSLVLGLEASDTVHSSCGEEMENCIGLQDVPQGATVKMGNQWHRNLRWLNGLLWAPDQIKAPGKIILTPTPGAHTLQTLLPALQPPNEILILREAAGPFIAVSGLQESKSEMDVFLWELARPRRKETPTPIQACFNLWRGGGGREPNWPRNQWESHQFCLSSQQRRILPVECCPPFLFFS